MAKSGHMSVTLHPITPQRQSYASTVVSTFTEGGGGRGWWGSRILPFLNQLSSLFVTSSNRSLLHKTVLMYLFFRFIPIVHIIQYDAHVVIYTFLDYRH